MSRDQINGIGRGISLSTAVAGVIAGAALGALDFIGPFIGYDAAQGAAYFFIASFAAFCFLVERGGRMGALAAAFVIGAIVAAPAYAMDIALVDTPGRASAVANGVWFAVAAPVGAYLMIAFAKAYVLRQGVAPRSDQSEEGARGGGMALDAAYFLHALTIPLIMLAAALLIAPVAAVLAVSALTMGEAVGGMAEIVERHSHFVWPVGGGLIGLAIGAMRGRSAVFGAMRYIAVAMARISTPALMAAAAALLGASIANGPWVTLRLPYPSAIFILLVGVIWVCFNGLRQSGEGGAPPLWLRIPALILLLIAPFFAWYAWTGVQDRIDAHGFTPLRLLGVGAAILALAHAGAGVVYVFGQFIGAKERWIPVASRLNPALGLATALALMVAGSPLIDLYALSAANQRDRLLSGRVAAEDFDYPYLRFELGPAGDAALDDLLAAVDHPEAATIRAKVELAQMSKDRAAYEAGPVTPSYKRMDFLTLDEFIELGTNEGAERPDDEPEEDETDDAEADAPADLP
ncbi:MAG: hypothetical protein AAFX08_08680 [Pseudomonadota bacterium]